MYITGEFAMATIVKFTWNGNNGVGACSVSGVNEGDRLFWLTDNGDGISPFDGAMEHIVSVDDQVQQVTGTDLSTHIFEGLFVRNA